MSKLTQLMLPLEATPTEFIYTSKRFNQLVLFADTEHYISVDDGGFSYIQEVVKTSTSMTIGLVDENMHSSHTEELRSQLEKKYDGPDFGRVRSLLNIPQGKRIVGVRTSLLMYARPEIVIK